MSIFNDGILRNQGKGIKQEQLVAINDLMSNLQDGNIIVYNTIAEMKKSNPVVGTKAIVEETKVVYIYTGPGNTWIPVGTVGDFIKTTMSGYTSSSYYTSSNNDITYINSL